MEAMVAHFKQAVVAMAEGQHSKPSVAKVPTLKLAKVLTLKLAKAMEPCFELAKVWRL